MARREDTIDRRLPGSWPLRMLARAANDPLTAGGLIIIALTAGTIVSNALLLQEGRHPAPLFYTRSGAEPDAAGTGSIRLVPTDAARPAPRPTAVGESASSGTAAPEPSELVADIQKALAERDLYDGPIDGLAGTMTHGAIRAFEEKRGLSPTGEPSPRILAALQLSGMTTRKVQVTTIKAPPVPRAAPAPEAGRTPTATPTPPAPVGDDRIAKAQKALNNLGYGPLDVDGLMGSATAGAIRRFELDRGLPITGTIGDKLFLELIAIGAIPAG
ncbi:peptidoglycan-binding domain-containing protein [Rhodobium gokarnense]|uniref:Peptidoglycan hydrolase-like protein with peptidoglycan-binding domain n=1 Tax=Rhodobium gokarnense TaxID=364296 RepID=A0ABT3HBY1_9HYPH|nr:peptidoglycan-binding domain-containing protein [Rhodobium gokarnense]MCW2307913.1 peptidoglycan hydrolase-like protein with peptidoglycan-binding domain [Rhodobium gokarnense]